MIRCLALLACASVTLASAQTTHTTAAARAATVPAAVEQPAPPPPTPTRAQILRGGYGPYRANNDLTYYHLDVRVDPVAQTIRGRNSIQFRMLEDGDRIQIDLTPDLHVDKILLSDQPLKFVREASAVFIDFPVTLRSGLSYTIDFYYSGHPVAKGRFGGMSFEKDPAGRPWVFTACEDDGSSVWWPSKDQWRDEPQTMDISVAVPSNLTDVSNGKFVAKTDLGDGYTRWDWHVSYPINSYDVALNIGTYTHFTGQHKTLPLDFYVLPEDLAKAKTQFAQVDGMLDAYEHYLGEYPFTRDGYKVVQVPYAGMEHQSAIAYGNRFVNGYTATDGTPRDWTGIGISPRFDFILIHESGHEWFGNSITAADSADMWIHEGWTTYLETLYVEYHYGKPDALRYLNALKAKVKNLQPIIGERGIHYDAPQDMYFKGALMIGTLRSIVDSDVRFLNMLHDFYQRFKYLDINTEQVVNWWNSATGRDLTPIFNQYLRHTAIPCLELHFDDHDGTVSYKWQADEPGFAMPIKVGDPNHWQLITPTTNGWQTMKTPLSKEHFQVATDLYFVNVSKT